jgi:hypothetical protein
MRQLTSSEFEIPKKKFIEEVMELTVLNTSQEISFDERSDDNYIHLFFGSSSFDHPSTSRYASIQETDPGAVTTVNGELHHSESNTALL